MNARRARLPWVAAVVVVAAALEAAPLRAAGSSVVTDAVACAAAPADALFCAEVTDSVIGVTAGQAESSAVLDAMAKQTYDSTLSQIVNCKGVFLTAECAAAFRAYTCAATFTECEAVNETHVSLRRPCRSMCAAYCDACFVDSCPCFDLPEDEDGGCFTVGNFEEDSTAAAARAQVAGIAAAAALGASLALLRAAA